MLPLLCRICQKPVTIGDLLLPTGPVCKACDTPENVPVAVRDCVAPDLDDPAKPMLVDACIPDFVLVRGAICVALEIEEWLHVQDAGGRWHLAASWNERYPGRLAAQGGRRVAFAVVLSWRGVSGKPFRDIGPLAFVKEPADEPVVARAVALNAARDWARRQARRLGLAAPDSYLPARTDFPGGV